MHLCTQKPQIGLLCHALPAFQSHNVQGRPLPAAESTNVGHASECAALLTNYLYQVTHIGVCNPAQVGFSAAAECFITLK